MKLYIVKKGKSISTGKGIVGAPVDPKYPTEKEIITVKHFKNGQAGLDAVLASEKCVLELFYELEESKNQGADEDSRPILKPIEKPVEMKPIEKPIEKPVEMKPIENKGAQKK
jgi:hypothetical protein